MIDTGIVRKSNLPDASLIVAVKKKEKSKRISYRKLNWITLSNLHPMAAAKDLFQELERY